MRTVVKGPAPECVRELLRTTPTASFGDLTSRCGEAMIEAFRAEQKGLCAFCCNLLDAPAYAGRTRIAHVSPQSDEEVPPTGWGNLVLSCDATGLPEPSCDVRQKDRVLPVSPLTSHVETLFAYRPSGRMVRRNALAEETIRVLNLDSPDEDDRDHRLRAARRVAILTAAERKGRVSAAAWSKLMGATTNPCPPSSLPSAPSSGARVCLETPVPLSPPGERGQG